MKQEKIRKICRWLFSIMFSLAMIAAVWMKTGIFFESNDDRYLTEILSGTLGGTASAQTVYVNYLYALPLTWLYQMTAAVPWYGLSLVFFLALSYCLVLNCLLECSRNKKQKAAAIAAVAILFLLNLFFASRIQYTSTAILLALSGYICLMVSRNPKKGLVLFGILSLFSFLMRRDSMLMVQPLGMAVVAGLIFSEKCSIKEKMKKLGRPVMIVACVILAGLLGNRIGYSGEEWDKYEKYNQARTDLFDYYGKPAYEEVHDILDRYGVSRAEYEGFREYVTLDWNISPECASMLADFAKNRTVPPDLMEIGETFVDYIWKNHYWGANRATVFLCIAAMACFVICRQYTMFLPLAFLQAGKLPVWFYLIYRGRLPERVVIPLFACESAFLIILVFISILRTEKWTVLQLVPILLLGCLICREAYESGRQQYRYVMEQNAGQEIFIKGMRELEDYCRKHPENKYLMDAISMSYYMGSALETEIYRPRNSTVTGCWYSHSPVMEDFQQEYLRPDGRGIHLIVYEDGRDRSHPAVAYLHEETETAPELVEKFTASHGGTYLVWYFPGEITFDGK